MKKILSVVLCLALLLCGCSADSKQESFSQNSAELLAQESFSQNSAELLAEEGIYSYSDKASAAEPGSPSVLSNRKLIRRINISAETEDMDRLLNELSTRIASLGGYVESRNIQNGSAYAGNRYRSATLVIRIPADQLDSFQQQVGQYSNIVSTNESTDDVTLQYVDTQSRLKVLRTEEERLLTFLADAASVSEMLEVEKRLTQVQSEIESLTSQLNTYDNLISYGTVTLHITEVEVYTPSEDPTLWQRIRAAFSGSLTGLSKLCQGLLVFFLGYSPYLLFYAVLVCLILLILWAVKRRKKKDPGKNEPPQASP